MLIKALALIWGWQQEVRWFVIGACFYASSLHSSRACLSPFFFSFFFLLGSLSADYCLSAF
jgi:hypothetical protein